MPAGKLVVDEIENSNAETQWQPTRTAVQDTSTGASNYDFTGIPSWVRRLTLILDQVSLSGTDDIVVLLGDSDGFEATGYISTSGTISNAASPATIGDTDGWYIRLSSAAAGSSIIVHIYNVTGNVWVCSSGFGYASSAVASFASGRKELSGVLTQLRIDTDGTDTFDAGQAALIYD